MTLRAIFVGLALAAAIFALFRFAGPLFFVEGRRAFQINFAGGAALGLALGLLAPALAGAPRGQAVRAAALIAVPGLLVLAAVASHFAVFFPALDPALDKVFGSVLMWFYGFALLGALLRGRK
jgi:hypothetical protein